MTKQDVRDVLYWLWTCALPIVVILVGIIWIVYAVCCFLD